MQERFCPNCGSENVEPDTSNAAYVAEAGGNPNEWTCNECEYTGLMPEGNPEDAEREIDFKPDDDYQRVDVSFGKGYSRYLVYVAIPLLIILLLVQFL